MPRTLIASSIANAVVHLGTLSVCVLLSLGSIEHLDDLGWEPPILIGLAEVVAETLMQPGLFLWECLGGGTANSDTLEWTVFIGNSLAWGVALASLTRALRRTGT